MLATNKISDGLGRFDHWKQETTQTIFQLKSWLQKHGLEREIDQLALSRCLNKLNAENITVAFVGEFSRGKTELINSLFFAGSGRRLLPSDAGRTTMCPTEIFYDSTRDEAYIRLLPIETRLSGETLDALLRKPEAWVELAIDPAQPDALEETFRELAGTHHVIPEEAEKYGLLNEKVIAAQQRKSKYIDIPKWRHAIISYPHPMLKQGLTLIDTPGLNAIGMEPELTLTMLPSAQAAIYVLGADTGVTQSDLDIWQQHLHGNRKHKRDRLTVVLNKIDTLWDELRSDAEIADTINNQILFTARMLGIPLKKIYPVSAQKALIGLLRDDKELLRKSGLVELEDHLNHELMRSRQSLVAQDIHDELDNILSAIADILQHRLNETGSRIDEIGGIYQQSDDAIESLLGETQKEQDSYRDNANRFNEMENDIQQRFREMGELVNTRHIENALTGARQQIVSSWTGKHVASAINAFAVQIYQWMGDIESRIEDNSERVRDIYLRFEREQGIGVIRPRLFNTADYRQQLENILAEASAFRQGYRIVLTSRSQLAETFFTVIGQKTRELFDNLQQDLNHWTNTVMQPLAFQIEDHRNILNRKIQDLKLATRSRDVVSEQLNTLNREATALQEQLQFMEKLRQQLRHLAKLL